MTGMPRNTPTAGEDDMTDRKSVPAASDKAAHAALRPSEKDKATAPGRTVGSAAIAAALLFSNRR